MIQRRGEDTWKPPGSADFIDIYQNTAIKDGMRVPKKELRKNNQTALGSSCFIKIYLYSLLNKDLLILWVS